MSKLNVKPFEIFNIDSAPKESVHFLEAAKESFGLIPNVEGVMALSPPLLASYMNAWDQFSQTSLTPAEQQIVYQATNFENNCEYCMPWHTIMSEQTDLPSEDVDALRQGGRLTSKKHESLRIFTRDLVRTNGNVEPDALSMFLEAGYSETNALEVVLGIAIKTMSNFTNAISQAPLDVAASSRAWKKPNLRA